MPISRLCSLLLFCAFLFAIPVRGQEGGSVFFGYDEKGRLRAVVTPNGEAAIYEYDAAGNFTGIRRVGSNVLELFAFSPHRGVPGDQVTFVGVGFGAGVSSVSFNGTPAQDFTFNATNIVATVPAGVTTGPVTITTANGSVTTAEPFTVMANQVGAAISCGSLVAGSISASGEVDQITFSGQATERKTLTLTEGGFPFSIHATATVYSPAGAVVVTFNSNSQQQLTLTESGTYIIQVRASDLVSTGNYSVGLECLLPTSPVDAVLTCGSLFANSVGASGEVDQITFSGQATERKTLTLTEGGFPFSIHATATVYSPAGAVVVTFNSNSQQQLTLPVSGTYIIQVRASDLVSTGNYSVGLECLLPTSPVDATLACGTLLSSRAINASGQVDQLTFSGQATERKTLTLTEGGFPFSIHATATVYSPAGAVVVTFNSNSQQQLTLTESGTYIIQVRASDLVSTGNYSVGLECLLPTSPVDATLACGTLLSSRAINASGQVDQLTFSGQATERKTLTLTEGGFPFSIHATATVYSPAGAVVVTFNSNSQQQLTLTESGTYIIQVRASDLVSTGNYSLGLECLLPTSPVDAVLTCGSLFANSVGASGEVDQITFSGQATERKTLTLTEGGFPFSIHATATVYSPAGAVVVTFNSNSQQQLTLTESGTYIIQVRASDLVSTGNYSVGLECLLPTSPVDAVLTCGSLVAGSISASNCR